MFEHVKLDELEELLNVYLYVCFAILNPLNFGHIFFVHKIAGVNMRLS